MSIKEEGEDDLYIRKEGEEYLSIKKEGEDVEERLILRGKCIFILPLYFFYHPRLHKLGSRCVL